MVGGKLVVLLAIHFGSLSAAEALLPSLFAALEQMTAHCYSQRRSTNGFRRIAQPC
jgi:hypothetical protein